MLVKDGQSQQIRDYWTNFEDDINVLESPGFGKRFELLFSFNQKRKDRCLDG